MFAIDTPEENAPSSKEKGKFLSGVAADDIKSVNLICASLTSERSALSRKIQRGCYVSLPMLAPEAILQVDSHVNSDVDWSEQFVLKGEFGTIVIAQGARFLRALTGIDLGAELDSESERWEWLQAAVLGRLNATPFSQADCILREEVSSLSDEAVLRVTLRTDQHVVSTYARAEAKAWLHFLDMTEWTPDQLPLSTYTDLPIEFSIRIARHALPGSMLRTLAAGDIVIPDSPKFTCDGEGSVRIGRLCARVIYEQPGSLKIIAMEDQVSSNQWDADEDHEEYLEDSVHDESQYTDDENNEESYEEQNEDDSSYEDDESSDEGMSEENPPVSAGTDDTSAIDNVSVMLTFELGKTRISLGELRNMGAGSLLSITGGSPASIAIVSSGKTLGKGEVVDVDGQLAIRITHWS